MAKEGNNPLGLNDYPQAVKTPAFIVTFARSTRYRHRVFKEMFVRFVWNGKRDRESKATAVEKHR